MLFRPLPRLFSQGACAIGLTLVLGAAVSAPAPGTRSRLGGGIAHCSLDRLGHPHEHPRGFFRTLL